MPAPKLTPLPSSLPAERDMIGMLLLDPERVWDALDAGLSAAHFYAPQLGAVYAELERRVRTNEPADVVTMADWAGRHPKAGSVVLPVGELVELPDHCSVPSLARHRATGIVEDARRRCAIGALEAAAQAAREGSEPLPDVLERVVSAMHSPDVAGREVDATSLGAAVRSVIGGIADARKKPPGLRYGYDNVDRITGGMHPGDVVVLAARTSMGKTALAHDIAHKAAAVGTQVVVYSLEDARDGIARRHLSARTGISGQRLRQGDVSADERRNLEQVADHWERTGLAECLHIVADPSLTMARIEADLVGRLQRGYRIGLVVIDYIQLVRPALGVVRESRQVQVADASGAAKVIALRHSVPVMILAQVNRQGVRDGAPPELHDLRDSGAIEQDADCVMFIHRPDYFDETKGPASDGIAQVIVRKNRHGATGWCELWFSRGHFHDYTPREED